MYTPSRRRGRGAMLVVAWALLASACGSGPGSSQADATPGPTPTASAPIATTSPAQSPTQAQTQSPTKSPAPSRTATAKDGKCVPIKPESGFYEAGRVGTKQLTTPASTCTTISVSDIRGAASPSERCKTFLVGFWPMVNGSLTYTDPVSVCGGRHTVLARNVPDDTRYLVLYGSAPEMPRVEFTVWH